MSMEKVRIHYIFHGTVQGVGFRYKACYSAKSRGVTGWVRNCSDGTVEMEAEGYPADIAAVIRELDEHSWGFIERIESENIPLEGGYGFEIRSPLKTSCERKCAVRTIFVVKPPRKAYSLTSSAFLEAGTPCPFLLFTPVFRGSLITHKPNCADFAAHL